ncbi:MAG: helix-turn-helix domain-containing protein, partial [Solobacterium sp.]|nr:helix-turn-helix domain-containing protein [Solobacterium sp.]
MSEFIKVSEAAKRWGISERRIAVLCRNGRIPGAYKNGRSWVLPADAQRPADSRVKSGIYLQSG